MKQDEFELHEFARMQPIGIEIIPAQLYDTQMYIPGVTCKLNFFWTVGERCRTNMEIPGMLPQPKSFLIESIRIYGIHSKLAHGTCRLNVGNKHYGHNPAWTYGLKEKGLKLHPALFIAPMNNFYFEIEWNPIVYPWKGFEQTRVFIHPIQVVLRGQMARSIS